jgi:hypothetical protein
MSLPDIEKRLLGLLLGQFSSLSISFNAHGANYQDARAAGGRI